jgi:hypothetical protein
MWVSVPCFGVQFMVFYDFTTGGFCPDGWFCLLVFRVVFFVLGLLSVIEWAEFCSRKLS